MDAIQRKAHVEALGRFIIEVGTLILAEARDMPPAAYTDQELSHLLAHILFQLSNGVEMTRNACEVDRAIYIQALREVLSNSGVVAVEALQRPHGEG